MGFLKDIMSMISKVILNINLYSPKISISTVFLLVLLLSLDPQTPSAFPEVKHFSHHLSLVLCELIFSSKTLIPAAVLICLLTTSTSCYYYSNTRACKNWAWWENLRTEQSVREGMLRPHVEWGTVCLCATGKEAVQSDSYGKYAMATLKTKQHQLKFWCL